MTAAGISPPHGSHWVEFDVPGGGCLAISNATPDTPSASAGGTIAFEVEDLDSLVDHLKANDVKVPAPQPIHGPNCRMVPARTPTGTRSSCTS